MKRVYVASVLSLILFGCGGSSGSSGTPNPAPSNNPVQQATQAVQQAVAPEPTTLNDAIALFKPEMSDVSESISPGALSLTRWSMTHLKWDELVALPTTTKPLVMKDSDEQRGKLICVTGRIIQISGEKVGDSKVYEGGMMRGYSDIYRFLAVKSTGNITDESSAKFCGVVIGKMDYANSAGGVAHAIQLVGMFDLPENTGKPASKK